MPKTSTSWKKGQSGNPAGRPEGSRNALSEKFMQDAVADWKEHGVEALERAREERPMDYCKMIASLVPKEGRIEVKNPASEAFIAALKVMNEKPHPIEAPVIDLEAEKVRRQD